MSHPLEQKIHVLRARVRRLVTLHGACWVAAAVLAAVTVLGATDYLIRFQDRGIRVICSLLVFGMFGWTCYRFLYLPSIFRLRDVDLAARVQRRFPELDDRLVSSVEFLRQEEDEPLAGSAALRRAVIAETTARTERLDFSGALDTGAPRRAAIVALSVFLVAATLWAADPPASSIALARLANPFDDDLAWPQRNLLRPRRPVPSVARGQAFRLEVIDERGNLPSEGRIYYQMQGTDGTVIEETRSMVRVDDAMEAVRENVVRPFYYRLEGGDYRAKTWTWVGVVDPPEIRSESLSITLVPPDYTGWPAKQQQGDAGRQIRALVETQMSIMAQTTRPIRSAALCLEVDGQLRRVPARVSDDGLHFTIPGPDAPNLLIQASQRTESYPYWFELTDRDAENIVGGQGTRGEIHAVLDTPPTVVMEQPTEKLFVTPQAAVPLQATEKDDLALLKTRLVFGPSDGPGQKTPAESRVEEPLDPGANLVPPRPEGWFAGDAQPQDRRHFTHLWELARWDFAPGTQLTFHIEAVDSRHQVGESSALRLIVITDDELQTRIAARQDRILAELAEVLKTQQEARKQVHAIETRLAELGYLEGRDLDRLQAAALNQSQADRRLAEPDKGVPRQIVALLSVLEINKVDHPDVGRHMHNLLEEIDRLRREHLPVIGRELTAAIKAARLHVEPPEAQPPDPGDAAPSLPDPALATSLTEAGKHQDRVIAALEEIRRRLSEWENYRRFHRQVLQLTQEQKETARRTAELGEQTVGKRLEELPPPERADLKILAAAQLEYARRLEQILQEMDQAGPELQQSDPLAAETVADALAEARRLAVSSRMQTCGDDLANNRIYQAAALQEQIVTDLQQVLDLLTGRRQQELARLLAKLSQAEADLLGLERQQEGLRRRIEACGQMPDETQRREQLQRLRREQEQLQQTAEQMATRLERLLADRASRATARAAARMAQAAQSAGEGDAAEASRQAGEARAALGQARDELGARRLRTEAELAMEQLARLADALKDLRDEQQDVVDRTTGLASGELDRTKVAAFYEAARQQRALQSETTELGERLFGAPAAKLALAGAARLMDQAAGALERLQTDRAVEAAGSALRRLDLLIEALKAEAPPADTANAGDGAGGAADGQNDQPGPPGGVQTVTELKVLQLLQEDINLRTEELAGRISSPETLTEGQRLEHALLGEEQGRLADLMFQLLQVDLQDPEDDPNRLPDLRQDRPDAPPLLPLEERLP